MRRDQALSVLRAHEPELRDAGVIALSLFGSVARDDAGDGSDVDVLVRLDETIMRSGFGYFGAVEQLVARLRSILGTDVDVVTEPVQKDRLRRAILKDRIVAF